MTAVGVLLEPAARRVFIWGRDKNAFGRHHITSAHSAARITRPEWQSKGATDGSEYDQANDAERYQF